MSTKVVCAASMIAMEAFMLVRIASIRRGRQKWQIRRADPWCSRRLLPQQLGQAQTPKRAADEAEGAVEVPEVVAGHAAG